MTLADILRELSIEFREPGEHHHATQGRLQVDCPWCSPRSGKFRMGLRPNGPAACWSCGFHQLANSLVELSGSPWREVKQLLSEADSDRRDDSRAERRGKLVLPDGLGPLLPAHIAYLRNRGFDPRRTQKLWNLQGIGPAAKLSWRIFVPISLDGEVVSWTTRKVGPGDGFKYWTARPDQEKVSSKDVLLGEDFCRHAVVVCEGPFDAMRIGPGAVATLGTVVSKSQAARIAKYPTRVVCLDAEPDAQRRARKLCGDLEAFPGTTVNVVLESAKDPGDASRKEIKELRRRFLE